MTTSRLRIEFTTRGLPTCIIFDIDGTLLRTLELVLFCVNKVSQKYLNRTLTRDEIHKSFGPPVREVIREYTKTLPRTTTERAVREYYNFYKSLINAKASLVPGTLELLERLHSSGKHLAVVTSVEKCLMECNLHAFGLKDYFDVFISADEVQKYKPNPEGILRALHLMNTTARNAMIIGDSPSDMQAGKAAGIVTGAALWNPEGPGDPCNESPDYEFRTVEEVLSFFSL